VTRRAASPREAAPQQARALWTDLLARLSLAAAACTQAQTLLALRELGLRRTGTVATNLARELMIADRMAERAGVPVLPLEVQRRIGELARPCALTGHLQGLATTYRDILLDPALPPDGPLLKWLAARVRVHLTQFEAMEQITRGDR